jgi:hypothetical protein
VALMLLIAVYANTWSPSPAIPMFVEIVVGFVLLFWYARE